MNSQKHSEVTFGEFLKLLKPYKIAIVPMMTYLFFFILLMLKKF
ncbi:hypothetical protein D8851_09310 [Streptococcus mitis]|nr:hypothetical protein D8851_09310 [Streptococcus mitis]RSJ03567.1 hypothetical protein D8840_02130 [Streptococcus mitis]SDP20096.1 hypothetical protein SAMN05216494_0779 [Streptococcus sp. NLAE-zl-C503]